MERTWNGSVPRKAANRTRRRSPIVIIELFDGNLHRLDVVGRTGAEALVPGGHPVNLSRDNFGTLPMAYIERLPVARAPAA